MTPQIVYLTDNARELPTGDMQGFTTWAEAETAAKQRGQAFVYKLAHQETWLVAK